MNFFRVQHRKVNAGQFHLLQNKLVQAATAVEALFMGSGNSLQFESTFVSLNSAKVERMLNGSRDLWCAVRE